MRLSKEANAAMVSYQNAFDKAEQRLREELIILVRRVLKAHKNLNHFVCAMGCYFFSTNDGEHIHAEDRAYMKPIDDFLDAYDEQFKITGWGVQIYADKIVTDF